jgi:hypothetical protein
MPDVVVGLALGQSRRHRQHRVVRAKPLTWDFAFRESTIAFSGGFRYKFTTSRSLASSSGSLENLTVSDRHGWRPPFFHTGPR